LASEKGLVWVLRFDTVDWWDGRVVLDEGVGVEVGERAVDKLPIQLRELVLRDAEIEWWLAE
jgi:hypothetical protein